MSVALAAPALTGGPAPAAAAAGVTPSLTITASTSTTVGLAVFANSNLMGGANPTGTLTFKLYEPGDTGCASPIFTSTVAVAGQSTNSGTFPTTLAGTYRWTSTYSGDGANTAVGPTACADPAAAVVVAKARTTLSVSAPAPSPVDGTIHGDVAVSGGYAPTGTVSYFLSPPGDTFCNSTVFTSKVAIHGAGTYSSAHYAPATTGTYKWRASYSGDSNSLGTSVTPCLDANAAVTVTTTAPTPTTTTTTTRPVTTTTVPPTTTTVPPTTTTVPPTTTTVPPTTTTVPPTTTTVPPTTTTVPPTTTTVPPTTTTTVAPATTTTTTTVPAPTSQPHWGRYRWGATTSDARAFWLFDRTGDPAMHTAIADWAAWWNDTRARVDPSLPFVAVYQDDASVGQCFHTGDLFYSLAMVCAGDAGTPDVGRAEVTVAAAPMPPHMVSPFAILRSGLDATSLAASVCHQMGSLIGLPTTNRDGSCMDASPSAGAWLWYDNGDFASARSLYDGHTG